MDVQQALWYILEKVHFYDFDFSDEFIQTIQTDPRYDGLYDILNLTIQKKFQIKKNTWTKIKTNNSYHMVQEIIDLYNRPFNIFLFQQNDLLNKQKLADIYDELDNLFDEFKGISISTESTSPHINILILLSYMLENGAGRPYKYTDNIIKKKCIMFRNMLNIYATKNIDLISKHLESYEHPKVAKRFIEFILKKTQMVMCIA